jgi:hypothetical protein
MSAFYQPADGAHKMVGSVYSPLAPYAAYCKQREWRASSFPNVSCFTVKPLALTYV